MEAKPDENGNGNGSGRATVALVDAKMDTVLAEVRGGFKDLQRQLDGLEPLRATVAALHERQTLSEVRIRDIEQSDAMQATMDERRKAYRRGPLPTILISLFMAALGVLNVVVLVYAIP